MRAKRVVGSTGGWCCVNSDAGLIPNYCQKDGAELKGKALNLLVPSALISDQKNEVMDSSS